MSQTVLDSIALGYQPVWNRLRQLAAVRLCVQTVHPEAVDAEHLMETLGDDWPVSAPVLILAIASSPLLRQALACQPVQNTWLEVPADWFSDETHVAELEAAAGMGHVLLRRGDLSTPQDETDPPLAQRSLLSLSAEQALEALRTCTGRPAEVGAPAVPPFLAGQLYEGMGSAPLATACLDQGQAWGVLGWPHDDVLHAIREQKLNCEAAVIAQALVAIDRDSSLDQIERVLRQDPLLVYRLLVMSNGSDAARRHEIESMRHAILMLGFSALRRWLAEQKAGGTQDAALHPVRYAMSMRARLAQHLLESGSDADLRAEVYTTALLSQIDHLEHQPLEVLLERVSLPERMQDALLRHSGPYQAYIEVASAQGDASHLERLPGVCQRHGITLEHANRALVRMLGTSRDHSVR